MLRVKKGVDLEKLKMYGFKYGTRDKFIYKTTQNGTKSEIYIDLMPCNNNNNNNQLHVNCESFSVPEKILNVLYELSENHLIEEF